jgi:hypothetical protein
MFDVVTGYHIPGGNKYGNLAVRIGKVSNLRKLNLVMSPAELRPDKAALARPSNNCKLNTCPLVRKDAS